MIIFWRLVLGHFLADFTFQTNRINAWKRSSMAGMLAHCLIHPICYMVLLWPYLSLVWFSILGIPIHGTTAVLLIGLLHYLEDVWRVRIIQKNSNMDTTLFLLWDQFVHLAVIFILFGEIPGAATKSFFPEIWPVIGVLAVIATHFSIVFLYFVEKDIHEHNYPNDNEKYLTLAERGSAFAAILLIANAPLAIGAAGAALILPRILASRPIENKIKALPHISWALGGLIAVGTGLLGRLLLN